MISSAIWTRKSIRLGSWPLFAKQYWALSQAVAAHRHRVNDLRTAAHQLLNPREVSTRDESVAKAEATDLRSRAENRESQIPGQEKQLAKVRDQIDASEQTEVTLRNRLLVP